MAAGKWFWYLQRDFLSLIREFSVGKLKQKGFFHSVQNHEMLKYDYIRYILYQEKAPHKKRSTVQPFALLRNTQSCDATSCDAVVAGFIAKEQPCTYV
jgi:hypothetical protein